MSCLNMYICLKLSMASTGRSFTVLPKWWSGWVNFEPSAVRKLTLSENTNKNTCQNISFTGPKSTLLCAYCYISKILTGPSNFFTRMASQKTVNFDWSKKYFIICSL